MYQNVSNVAFYEKNVWQTVVANWIKHAAVPKHFPDEIWHQSVNGFVVVADLPLSVLVLHVMYLLIHFYYIIWIMHHKVPLQHTTYI